MSEANVGIFLHGARQLKVEPVKIQKIENDNDVQVEIKCVGIGCSDISLYENGYKDDEVVVLGRQEASGVVLQVGSNVHSLSRGDRIGLSLKLACSKCDACKAGDQHLCAEPYLASDCPGFLQSTVTVPENICYLISDSITMESAAILDSIANMIHICRKTNIQSDHKVCISGYGPEGHMLFHVLKAIGITEICTLGYNESYLMLAESSGSKCCAVVDVSQSVDQNYQKLQGSCTFKSDVTFELTGTEHMQKLSKKITKPDGIIAILGNENHQISILEDKTVNAMYFQRTDGSKKDLTEAVTLVDERKIQCKDIITHRYTSKLAVKAFKNMSSGSTDLMMKCIFRLNDGEY